MTPADLARAIHDRHCAAAAARKGSSTSWSNLAPFQRDQLEDDARRLQSAYASGCDAPSRGMRPQCSRCKHFVIPDSGHLCSANHAKDCDIRTTRDGWDADCSCERGEP